MSFQLPNPTVPTNGQSLDAGPILENFVAIQQAIASFDASQIEAGTIVEAAFADIVNPRLRFSETAFDFVASGCVWSADAAGSTLAGSMTAGVVYIKGYRIPLSSIAGHLFSASKDTYVDVDDLGNITYTEVTNNAASPSLAANSIRLAIIVTGAGNIASSASINQGQETALVPIASSTPYAVTDSLGNLINPRDSSRKVLGYRQILTNFAPGTTAETVITGLIVPVIIPTGRKIKVTAYTGALQAASGTSVLLARNGTTTGGTQVAQGNASSTNIETTADSGRESAYSGSQSFVASVANASSNPTVGATANQPAYIKVELE